MIRTAPIFAPGAADSRSAVMRAAEDVVLLAAQVLLIDGMVGVVVPARSWIQRPFKTEGDGSRRSRLECRKRASGFSLIDTP